MRRSACEKLCVSTGKTPSVASVLSLSQANSDLISTGQIASGPTTSHRPVFKSSSHTKKQLMQGISPARHAKPNFGDLNERLARYFHAHRCSSNFDRNCDNCSWCDCCRLADQRISSPQSY